MNNLLDTLINSAKKLIIAAPVILLVSLALYSAGSDSGKQTLDSLILQTPAAGLVSGGYDYYPKYLDDNDVVVYQKNFTDENGNEYTGAVIEVRKPVAFATPADTKSMQPMFGAGNTLVQEVVDDDTVLEKGDIIVYADSGKLIIHQIVGQLEGCYITKGINNAIPDSVCVTKDKIKYRLLFAIPTG